MGEFFASAFDYMKDRFRSPFFVNITVVWMAIHWKVIYITLFVSSEDVFPIFWNKFEYVNSFMSNYKWQEDYFFPIVIGTFFTIIKHPILMTIDKYVEEFKVKRKDLVDSINKTGNYQKWKESEDKVNDLSIYKQRRDTFLFFGNWFVKWVKDGGEATFEEYEYEFKSNNTQIIGNNINTTNKQIPEITITNLNILFPVNLTFSMNLRELNDGNPISTNFKCVLNYSLSEPDSLSGTMTQVFPDSITEIATEIPTYTLYFKRNIKT